MANANLTMDDLLAGVDAGAKQLTAGETVTGTVLSLKKHEVLIDLGAHGVGFVPRREVGFSRNVNEGDEVTASVVDTELDNGYSLLSLRKAAKDRGWEEVAAKFEGYDIEMDEILRPDGRNEGDAISINFEDQTGDKLDERKGFNNSNIQTKITLKKKPTG